MNQKLKTAWITALRSGKYRQTTARLKTPGANSYCCLGVLCEVAGMKNFQNARTLDGSQRLRKLRDALGIGTAQTGVQKMLIHLNDTQQESFKKIANYIEKHVK